MPAPIDAPLKRCPRPLGQGRALPHKPSIPRLYLPFFHFSDSRLIDPLAFPRANFTLVA